MANFYIDLPVEGGGGGGGITSINGNTSAAQLIAGGSGITVSSSGGTTTISTTNSAGNPQSSPTLRLNLDASTPAPLGLDGSFNVSQWADTGPFHIVGEAGSSTNSPLWAANLYNGNGATRWSDASHSGDEVLDFGTIPLLNQNLPFTLACVFHWTGFTGSFPMLAVLNTDTTSQRFLIFLSNQSPYFDLNFGASGWIGAGANIGLTPNTTYIVQLTYNGLGPTTLANFVMLVNGTAQTLATSSAFNPSTGSTLIGGDGVGDSFDGDIMQFSIDASLLTSPDLFTQRAYLSNKWL